MKIKDILVRYAVATLGLVLVALGVALSLKSNLGTAPASCPPAVLHLRWTALSVGTFTWIMHLVLILGQMALKRKVFEWNYLLQLAAAFVFGYLCDAWIWLIRDVQVPSYAIQLFYSLLTVLVTAVGIRLEVIGNAWILAGDQSVVVLAEVCGRKFSNVKIAFDIFLVILSAGFAFAVFGPPFGDGNAVVIREGTVILALFTGACMELTDPLVDKLFKPVLHE